MWDDGLCWRAEWRLSVISIASALLFLMSYPCAGVTARWSFSSDASARKGNTMNPPRPYWARLVDSLGDD
jgi:hypothetical protein